eukprot:TRINITY_DN9312_c0_g1_i1.p1 TRINITY_DN9312_c0_g1~~TRINITY_DN9312_c0_g1_i1.p1  ORF type:complete len:1378 (+),score=270.24 TRINITY_DN9312_c0_g1_i1:71-4204(+)
MTEPTDEAPQVTVPESPWIRTSFAADDIPTTPHNDAFEPVSVGTFMAQLDTTHPGPTPPPRPQHRIAPLDLPAPTSMNDAPRSPLRSPRAVIPTVPSIPPPPPPPPPPMPSSPRPEMSNESHADSHDESHADLVVGSGDGSLDGIALPVRILVPVSPSIESRRERPLPKIPPNLEKEIIMERIDRIERLLNEETKRRKDSDTECARLRRQVEDIQKRESFHASSQALGVSRVEIFARNSNEIVDPRAQETSFGLLSTITKASEQQELLEYEADILDSVLLIQRWYRRVRIVRRFRLIISTAIKDSHNRDIVRAALNAPVQRSRIDIVKEIVDRERNYVKNLTMICQYFLFPLKTMCKTSKQVLEESEIEVVFMHIDLFLQFHRRQLIEMENLIESDQNTFLLDSFSDLRQLLPEYFIYTGNYGRAVQLIHSAERRPAFTSFLKKAAENPYCGRFPLPVLLYIPISYINRTTELLAALQTCSHVETTEQENVKKTLEIFNNCMVENQEESVMAENLQKIISIQHSLHGYQPDASFYDRIFIREGLLNKVSKTNEDSRPYRYFFLFTDTLLVTSIINHPQSPFKVIQEYKLSEMLVETLPDTPKVKNMFDIITTHGSRSRFFTSSPYERQMWIDSIKTAITKYMRKVAVNAGKVEPPKEATKTGSLKSGFRKLKTGAFGSWRSEPDVKQNISDYDIHKACISGNIAVLQSLLQQGQSVEKANSVGDRPLHLAAAANEDRIMIMLLQARASVNVRNLKGETPLHVALSHNHVKAARILLEKGADPKIQDNDGRRPADLTTSITLKYLVEDMSSGKSKRHSIAADLSNIPPLPQDQMTPSKQPASNRLSIKPGAEIAKLLDNFGDDGFVELLSGESLAIKIDDAVDYICGNLNRPSRLILTNYRLVIYSGMKGEESHSTSFQVDVPIFTVDSIEKISLTGTRSSGLEIKCKDFRTIRLGFGNVGDHRKRLYKTLCDNVSPFAFFHNVPIAPEDDGWSVYTVESDFARMNVPDAEWKLSDVNSEFRLCPTYNRRLAVPKIMIDTELKSMGHFRSRGRIPVLSWRRPSTGATICRSSQPRSGITGARCPEDEKFLKAVSALNKKTDAFYIIDCRPRVNAVANQAKGAGFENPDHYTNCQIVFMDIENIHVVRDSWRKLQEVAASLGQGDDSRWYSALENTHWLIHVQSIIRACKFVVEQMELKGCSFLVHCSDGWDRTSQVVALSELLLDPHYRTIRGFEALVEKEWLSFGHKFGTRCGHGPANRDNDQRSPVFLQFLDCVWQITRQYPDAFEFNELFLITIMDHVYSCRFGTFLCDSVYDRSREFVYNTTSLWTWMNEHVGTYRNASFKPRDGPINPSDGMWNLRLWTRMYLRWTGLQPLVD